MSEKDYIVIAKAFQMVIARMRSDNPSFDEDKFIKACRVKVV